MLLTKTFSAEQYLNALESWGWIGIGDRTPVLSSLFGDIFLQDPAGYWFLDTTGGDLALVWPNRDAIQTTLDAPEGQDRYLLGGLAFAAENLGVVLADNEVYDFMPPPILGGSFAPENIVATDFVVAVNLAGQLHSQLVDMPPGTQISGFTVDGSAPQSVGRRRRRRRRS